MEIFELLLEAFSSRWGFLVLVALLLMLWMATNVGGFAVLLAGGGVAVAYGGVRNFRGSRRRLDDRVLLAMLLGIGAALLVAGGWVASG